MATRSTDTALVAVPAADLSALLAEVRELRAEVRELRDAQPVEWLVPEEAGAVLGLTVQRLADLRSLGGGPAFARVGRTIRYRRADLDGWLMDHIEVPATA